MTFMQWIFAAFAAVAVGGIAMVLMVALRAGVPRALRSIHGLLALGSLALLFGHNLHGGTATTSFAWWAFGMLSAVLLGALALFRAVFPGRPPFVLVCLHGAWAATGLYLLYLAAW
jgi:hypothetical protein